MAEKENCKDCCLNERGNCQAVFHPARGGFVPHECKVDFDYFWGLKYGN